MLIFGIASSSAQEFGGSGSESSRHDVLKRISASKLGAESTTLSTYEGVVDQDSYRVGPGDKLMLQIWSPAYEESPTVVTGEGRVAVPFTGAVQVAGLSLGEAEAAIVEAFEGALRRGRISVSLLEPRRFRVHVTGEVRVPGTYALPATARVADAVELAGGAKTAFSMQSGDTISVPTAALRQIEMRDARDGNVTSVDLLRFYQGGDISGNPYLQDGAVVYVPPKSAAYEVGVFGEVRSPGLYEYAAGDDIKILLSLAGGLTALADSQLITMQSGDKLQSIDLSSSSKPVNAGDRIYVGGKPKSITLGSVTLSGQVGMPGGYTIIPGTTTVSEILDKAGGLLPDAALQSARLIRRSDDRISSERRRMFLNPSKTSTKEDPHMLADIEMSAEFARWEYGTVVLDLSAQQGEAGWAGDVVLLDGDQLDVPSQPLGVRVLGYVNNAGEVPWVEGASLNHYLKQAGGKNSAGWKGRAVILKARNGSQLRYSSKVSVDPGDVLFIPQRQRTTSWERVKDVISVVAQLATIVLVIDTATKR